MRCRFPLWLTVVTAAGCGEAVEPLRPPPCSDIEVVPSLLNFGAVERTRSLRRAVEVRNAGAVDCALETRFRCEDGTRRAPRGFVGLPERVDVPAGATATLVTEFTPYEVWDEDPGLCPSACGGALEMWSTGRVVAEARLAGVIASASPPLVVPNLLTFSSFVGCPEARVVTLYAAGTRPLVITALGPPEPAVGFEVEAPPLPLELAPGESLAVPVRFTPRAEGRVDAELSMGFRWTTLGCAGPEERAFVTRFELMGIGRPGGPCPP